MGKGKKNIVILIGQLVYGGAEKQSLLLAKALSEEYNVSYVVLKPSRVADQYLKYLRESDLKYEILEGSGIGRMKRLVRLLRSSRIDLLFCYLPGDNIAGTLAGKLASVPHIIGGIRNTKIVKRKFYLLRFVQKHFQEYVIFNSSRAMEIFCAKGYRRDRCLVIENAFADQLEFMERADQEPVRILMVGRFVAQKDYLTGIKAVATLSELVKERKIKLIIAGYGNMEPDVREWVQTYGLAELTEFRIQPDDLPKLYRMSDIYLNSSIFEGFSNSVMEALAHGLPVIATRTGDIEKLVSHGNNGYIADVGDHEALGKVLHTLCSDHATRLKFGREGHQHLYSNFSLETFKEKYIRFIQTLS